VTGAIVITGGARGIGAATARLAAARGSAVAVSYRTQRAAADALVAEIAAAGGAAAAVEGDVSTEAGVSALFAAVDEWRGDRPLVGLVNCAGVDGGRDPIERVTAADLAPLFTVNVIGTVLCCREAVRRMAYRNGGGGGAIVNISSMSATIGGRSGGAYYAASKAAVDTFTVGLAKEVAADGVRVNAVRPGMTLTDMTAERLADPATLERVTATIPMHRVATADEIAQPIVWLLSQEQASFVSGCIADVSGGGFLVGESAPRRGDDQWPALA
jgi:NAD(P)-dependent dehydrogenase (short-subunit alcohol dehydrogenase family)